MILNINRNTNKKISDVNVWQNSWINGSQQSPDEQNMCTIYNVLLECLKRFYGLPQGLWVKVETMFWSVSHSYVKQPMGLWPLKIFEHIYMHKECVENAQHMPYRDLRRPCWLKELVWCCHTKSQTVVQNKSRYNNWSRILNWPRFLPWKNGIAVED